MIFSDFIKLKASTNLPPGLPPLLKALLLDASGDWDAAHSIAQDIPSDDGSWVHAYLHRKEGDHWNANYWYSRAGRRMPEMSLEEEWIEISKALCEN